LCAQLTRDLLAIAKFLFHTKRGDDIPTGTPLTGASNAGGVGKKRNSERICGFIGFWCLQRIYRVTLISVFLGHFRINLHQTRTQYSNEGPQHWNAAQFPKKRFLNVEFCRRKTVVLTFLRSVSSKFAAVKNQ